MGAARTWYVTRYAANILNSHPWRFRRVTHNTRTVPPWFKRTALGIGDSRHEKTLFIRDRNGRCSMLTYDARTSAEVYSEHVHFASGNIPSSRCRSIVNRLQSSFPFVFGFIIFQGRIRRVSVEVSTTRGRLDFESAARNWQSNISNISVFRSSF